MLIVRWELASGSSGEDIVLAGDKWVFGRPDGEEVPTVEVDDPRVSRGALVIRDSGPGPVVFRGQRGDATVALRSVDEEVEWLEQGTAGHLTNEARHVEMHVGQEHVITLEVDFAERGTVVERQQEVEASTAATE